MGLDMYLYRVERPMLPYINNKPYDAKRENPELYSKMKPYIQEKYYGTSYKIESLFEDIGCWSAAQVHKWLLNKLQVEHFDNLNYVVSEEWLRELFAICLEILEKIEMKQERVATSYIIFPPRGITESMPNTDMLLQIRKSCVASCRSMKSIFTV